jgi:predicted TIM-barrel fold metal-dependent hydrolase
MARKSKWFGLVAPMFFSVLLVGCEAGAPAVSQPPRTSGPGGADGNHTFAFTINDAHCHFVNFLQESEGLPALLAAMDNSGVNHVVLMGLPLVKKWDAADPKKPTYYNDNDSKAYYYGPTDVILARAVLELPETQRRRIHPMICGFNPTDKNAIDHVRRMMEWYGDLWQGIGEILTRHDDLGRMTEGETARANHPALKPVYDFAADHDLPVWVHSNLGTVGLEQPIYLEEIRSAVKDSPRTRFVWCHAGYTRNLKIPSVTQVVDGLLAENKNLWIDLAWVVYEGTVAPGGAPDPRWVALIEKYPDRFLIGSDKIGAYGTYRAEIRKFDPLLAALKPATAEAIASRNLLQVLPARVAAVRKATAQP